MRVAGLKRYAYVFLAFMQAGLTSGIIYGWPALEAMLIKDGVYRDHCHPDDARDVACGAQKSYFNLMYTGAVFLNNAAPLLTGVMLDTIGPKWTNVGSAGLFFLGCGLFAIPYDLAKIPAFALLGVAGPGVYCSIMHLCNLFPGHQSSVLSFFSGTFSASSFIFKVFELIYTDHSFRTLPSIFIESPWFVIGAFIWPNKAFEPPGKKSIVDAEAEQTPLISQSTGIKKNKQTLYNVPIKRQFMSLHYWIPVAWLALEALAISCCHMASVFNIIWSFGWVAIPLFGLMMDYYGSIFSMNVTSVGLALFCLLKLFPHDYVHFVLVSTVNVGMWAIFYSYLSHNFGFDHYGKLLGVSSITVASVGALQYAFDYATNSKFHGNYLFADIVFMCTSVVCLFFSIYMWYVERKGTKKTIKIIEHYPPINAPDIDYYPPINSPNKIDG